MARFLFVWVLVLVCLVAPGQVTKTEKGFLLRMKWAVGDTYSYSVTSTADLNGTKIPMNGSYSLKAQSVKEGVADVLLKGVMPPPIGEVESVTKFDSRGVMGDDARLAELGARLPEKAVPLGGSWTETKEVADDAMKMSITSTYTLKRMEIVDGVPCVVISVVLKSSGTAASSGTGTMYYETRTGQLYKSELNMSLTIQSGETKYDVKSTTTVKRS